MPSGAPDGAVFFITICCRQKNGNQLCIEKVASELLESVRFRHHRGDWFVHLWLMMPDHVHALISFPPEKSMRAVVAKWKEVAAKKTGVRWQRDFFDHRLRGGENYAEKAWYVRMNPVRRGLVQKPEDWVYVWEGC